MPQPLKAVEVEDLRPPLHQPVERALHHRQVARGLARAVLAAARAGGRPQLRLPARRRGSGATGGGVSGGAGPPTASWNCCRCPPTPRPTSAIDGHGPAALRRVMEPPDPSRSKIPAGAGRAALRYRGRRMTVVPGVTRSRPKRPTWACSSSAGSTTRSRSRASGASRPTATSPGGRTTWPSTCGPSLPGRATTSRSCASTPRPTCCARCRTGRGHVERLSALNRFATLSALRVGARERRDHAPRRRLRPRPQRRLAAPAARRGGGPAGGGGARPGGGAGGALRGRAGGVVTPLERPPARPRRHARRPGQRLWPRGQRPLPVHGGRLRGHRPDGAAAVDRGPAGRPRLHRGAEPAGAGRGGQSPGPRDAPGLRGHAASRAWGRA